MATSTDTAPKSAPDTAPDIGPDPAPSSFALKQWQFYLLTGISAAALGLVFVTTTLSASNVSIRKQLDERQQFINESIVLSQLNVQLAQVLANLAIATKDDELKTVLWNNGITFSEDSPTAGNKASLTPGTAAGARLRGEAADEGN
jgi:hypothetical protein